ncbi:MAG: WbqC family protein [Vicinamibacteria bacterium]|nr:WbqC family protein [Vicinamibacteria bacterium]
MILSINQPAWLPWPGYFHRVARSDLHVVLDHVQFEKDSFVNRNRVRTAGGTAWLTVPVRTAGRFGVAIDALEIADDGRWARKQWDTLRFAYARAPHFAAHAPFFEQVFARPWPRLLDLLLHVNGYLSEALGVRTPLRRSSELRPQGRKSELVLELCRGLGATTYLSGPLGRDYLELGTFRSAGIAVEFDDYAPPVYPQCQPGPFAPGLSVVDLLFNCGPEAGPRLLAPRGAFPENPATP